MTLFSSINIPGSGIVKGLWVTARNMVGSYFERKRMTTEQYPEERPILPEANRSFPFLVFDGTDSEQGMRCVACKICEKECPPQCITIEVDRDANGKALKRPKQFDIDISVCMSCQICVEVCPFDSIRMDQVYELSSTGNRFETLMLHKEQLLKPNEYYRRIHPTEAAETDARLEADRVKKQAAAAAKAAKAPAAGVPSSEEKSA